MINRCADPGCTKRRAKNAYLCAMHRDQAKPKKGHKYHAKATDLDGVRFDSKAEAKRYAELLLLEKAGEIEDLQFQPRFALLAASTTGQVVEAAKAMAGTRDTRVGEYRGDFSYHSFRRGHRVVEDVKGVRTPLYRWKKKHCEIQYGITILES